MVQLGDRARDVGRQELATQPEREFARKADEHQGFFANEITRVGRGYFVQTAYVHFPVEAHSWLPFVQYLRSGGSRGRFGPCG